MSKKKGHKPAEYTSHDRDKELVIEALDGDSRAYDLLMQKYKPIVYTAAKRRLPWKEVEDLEDITMIVLGNAFLKLNQYDPSKSKLFTWIIACVHNYINTIPKQKKRVETYSIEDNKKEIAEKEESFSFDLNMDRERLAMLIRLLIDRLPEDIATAITMRYFKDASHEEIAEAIGCDRTVVWYKLQRGRELLKRMSETQSLFK
jgi:RNA polymerase sigma-70 factor (ECF subfamily)